MDERFGDKGPEGKKHNATSEDLRAGALNGFKAFRAGILAAVIGSTPAYAGDDLVPPVESNKAKIGLSGASVSVEEENYRLGGEIKVALDNMKNSRLKGDLQLLSDLAQYGVFVGLEAGKGITNFSMSTVMKIEGGQIKVSGAFLEKMMTFDFEEFNKSFDQKMRQSSLGIEFTKKFNNKVIRDLAFSLISHNTKNKNLGFLGNSIIDNAYTYERLEVYGGVRGAAVKQIALSTSLDLSGILVGGGDNFKLSPIVGAEQTQYSDIGGLRGEKVTSDTFGLEGVYQSEDNTDQLKLNTSHLGTSDSMGFRYGHKFDGGIEGFVQGDVISVNGMSYEEKVFAGVNIPLGGKTPSKYPPLFGDQHNSGNEKLNWSDLTVNERVASEQVYGQKATWERGVSHIDKTTLLTAFTMNEDTVYNGNLNTNAGNFTYAKVSNPANGTLVVNSNGTFTYTPNANYFGTDTFTYSLSDGISTINQVVTIVVNDVAEISIPSPTLSMSGFYSTSSNGGMLYYNGTNSPTIFASSPGADHYEASVNGGAWQNSSLSGIILVPYLPGVVEGNNAVSFRACDANNNCSSSSNVDFVKDQLNIVNDKTLTPVNQGGSINQTLSLEEEVIVVSVGLGDSDLVISTTNVYSKDLLVTGTAGLPGNKTRQIIVRDKGGNETIITILLIVNEVF